MCRPRIAGVCRGLLAAATLAVLLPARGAAQPVSGIVVEKGTGTPIRGAMVIMVDDDGVLVDRTLTNAAGGFVVRALSSVPHRIEVERIGYADWSTAPFRPGDIGPDFTVEVPPEAVSLEGLHVEGARRCESLAQGRPATARVWEEVRKALATESYTREAGLYSYTLRRFTRRLDRRGEQVLARASRTSERLPHAFEAGPIDQLVARGFVQSTDSGSVFYAPDAETLLSAPFLQTHCFGLREGSSGRVGLAFEPVPDRTVSEVGGVLWVDPDTWELERLEFNYQNLLGGRETARAGGEVGFMRLPNGAWIVRDWRITMPMMKQLLRGRLRRVGYAEEVGRTWLIADRSGKAVIHAESPTIFGVVTDSTGAQPPSAPVVVSVVGTGRAVTTDPDGSFVIPDLEAGWHTLAIQHPALAGWGLPAPVASTVEARLGEVAQAEARVPTLARALAASCGGPPRPEGTVAYLGRIVAPGGMPREGMEVVARWPGESDYGGPSVPIATGADEEEAVAGSWRVRTDGDYSTATTTTDRRGLFLLCDLPAGLDLTLAVGDADDEAIALAESFRVGSAANAVTETLTVPE